MAKLKIYEIDAMVDSVASKVKAIKTARKVQKWETLLKKNKEIRDLQERYANNIESQNRLALQLREIEKLAERMAEKYSEDDLIDVRVSCNGYTRPSEVNKIIKVNTHDYSRCIGEDIRRDIILDNIDGKIQETIESLVEKFS